MILKMPLKMASKVVGLTGIWFPKLQSKISPSVKINAHTQETLCIYILSIWEQPDAAVEIQQFNGRVTNALSVQTFPRMECGTSDRALALLTGAIDAKSWLAETFPVSARAAQRAFTTTWTSPTGSYPQRLQRQQRHPRWPQLP